MNARHVVLWLGGRRLVAHEAQTQGLDAPDVAAIIAKLLGMMLGTSAVEQAFSLTSTESRPAGR